MLPYRRCDCRLRIVCTAFIMVVTATFDQERQPVGLEMCKDHCGHCDDCTFCVFLIKRLACIATWSKYPLQTHGEEAVYLNISKKTLGSYSQRKELCTERHSRIVLTRSKGFRCIKRRTEEKTRLLIASYKGSRTPLRALHLPNGSITTYHNINQRHVLALAYVPTLQKLLMATSSPVKIRLFSLHSKGSLTVRPHIYVLSMAVDDAQQLVFLSSSLPHSCLYRMTPDGRYFKKITCRAILWAVCLDTRRELVYAASSRNIYSSGYDGQGLLKITSSNEVHGLALSDNGEAIYYKDKTNLMELWLFKNGRRRKLTRLHFRVKNIARNKGDLFISSLGHKFIHLWHESKMYRIGEANPASPTRQVIVLIP